MEMELVYKERNELKAKIEAQGIGAPTRWIELATSAMAGNKAAKAECAELLGREVKTMLDLYNIQSAAFDVATPGERRRSESSAIRALNTGHSAKNDANAYLANRLGSIRREKGMTQKELAKKAGVALVTLQKLENGSNILLHARTETTVALAKALEISVEELINGAGD